MLTEQRQAAMLFCSESKHNIATVGRVRNVVGLLFCLESKH